MKPTVVVIEDEPQIQELLRDVLAENGFVVDPYMHPFQACLMGPKNPALILIDLLLPERSGLKLAEYLRRNGYAHTPIVAISGDKVLLRLASASGLFQATMAKPFDLADLTDCVQRLAGLYVT